MNLNKAFIIGNLTRDPERKSLPSGHAVANFGVASNRFFFNQNREKQQETEFHNVVAFGRLAEIASQYLKKGSLVFIEGRIKTRNWEDSSKIKHWKTEIIAERMQLGPRFAPRTDLNQPPIKNPQSEDIPVIEENAEFSQGNEEIDVKDIPF